MVYRPLYNKILLQLEKKTTALIVEPDLQNAVQGIVISTGINSYNPTTTQAIVGPAIEQNDKVWFFIRDTKQFKINNQEYYLIEDADVLVVEK